MTYDWDMRVVWDARSAFAQGLLVSIQLTAIAILAGTLIGGALAVCLTSRFLVVRRTVGFLNDAIRALPVLVLLLWTYYLIPGVSGVRLSGFWTAALVLAVNLASFVADIFRGGIQSIPQDYVESAQAVGLPRFTTLVRIVMPETARRTVPGLVAMYITTFRMSTLASIISVKELFHVADLLVLERFRPLEIYTGVAILYLLVLLPSMHLAKWVERSQWFVLKEATNGRY